MASLNQAKVIKALEKAVEGPHSDFVYAFLKAYGTSGATVKLLQLGDRRRNVAAVLGDVAVKDRVYFRAAIPGSDLQKAADEIRAMEAVRKERIRFILVTDFETVLGVDLKVDDQVSFDFADFKTQYEFFLPLTGLYEKAIAYSEHPADVKASEKMGRLYDGIRAFNKYEGEADRHDLNLFLTRLLFCFFAEDTGIFPQTDPDANMMTDAFEACTQKDGTDADAFFRTLFEVLDMPPDAPDRQDLPESFKHFPYVDGGLFSESIRIPQFNARTRQMLIDCGRLSWREISPVIFGAMFQAVMDPEERRALGAHYTSEANIMKVIGPLFLDGLREELDWILVSMQAGPAKKRKLAEYHETLGRLQFLDPACGSGNFLIVAYREIRRLEIRCMAAMRDLEPGAKTRALNVAYGVKVHINHFHGIEILDFPADVARVSLYLMEHVMNLEMEKEFGCVYPTIPLKHTPGIVCANALKTPWESVVKAEELDYIFGNPPFGGAHTAKPKQKEELFAVFHGAKGAGDLDYVAAWYRLAGDFMLRNPRIETAFVSTNSVCQGTQVAPLWEPLLKEGFRINFAHRTFRWTSEAQGKAAVHCIVAGFSLKERKKKSLFSYPDGSEAAVRETCESIGPYLVRNASGVVRAENKPLSASKPMFFGNMPLDGGALIIEDADLEDFKRREPEAVPWIRKLAGSKELLHSLPRYCLWLVDAPAEVLRLPLVAERIERCRAMRLDSRDAGTRKHAERASLFRDVNNPARALAVPGVSSERRPYVPMAYVNGKTIVTHLAYIVPDASLYDFGIAESAMHMAWMRIVCGRLKSDYRYSRDLCWNTFPWPATNVSQKARIEELADGVLAARDEHPDMCLADMYNPESMPEDLKAAHEALDLAVDDLYRPGKPFESDEDRLQLLFQMYEDLIRKKEGRLHA